MFITLEGMEGSGKSTLLGALATAIRAKGHELLVTREPGGSALGVEIRAKLLTTEAKICPEAELFLFLADRAQHVKTCIRPFLEEGHWVLCDRYADSTIVYQGYGRGIDPAKVVALNEHAINGLWPKYTILLDVPVKIGLERALKRNAEIGLATKEGRFEAEAVAFHKRVREGFIMWAKQHKDRFIVLDGRKSSEDVAHDAIIALRQRACDV